MLMGHNADDFVEYYFMQKSKKSKPLFYGIKKENYYHDFFKIWMNEQRNFLKH